VSAEEAEVTVQGTTGAGTIYVLLPVHDRRAITEEFVRGLLDQVDARFHLVLIDDGSSDGTAESVVAMLPSTTVISGDGTWWWAGSLQQGYRWLAQRDLAGDDLVLIANDDTRFAADFLAAGRAALAGRPRTLLLAQLYDGESGEFMELGVHVNWRRLRFTGVKDPDRVNCFSPRGLFVAATEFLGSCRTTCPTTSSRSGRSDGASRSCPIRVFASGTTLPRRASGPSPGRLSVPTCARR
jgi:hypothetical protein